jgi:ketosteroid isomerase-like protein
VTADLIALIDRYNAAWNEQDLASIRRMHAPNMVFQNHTAGDRVEGEAEVAAHIAGIFARLPDLRFSGRSLRAGPDFVVSEWTAKATDSAGRLLEWDGVDIFPFAGGKIIRKDVYSSSGTPRVLSG